MFEDKYIYVVHSDTDENNIYAEFENEVEALEYAKTHVEEQTYVERVYCEADMESGEIVDVYETEVIWDYANAEDLNEFLDAKVNVDFDGGDNNDVRVLSSFDPETEGEPLDEFLDADINVSLDGGTGNKVDVLSKSLGEEVTEPKWNIGSNKLVSRFSQEYKNLEKLADMLEAQAGSNETYVVDRTYEDYGAGMEWYTIIHICDLERDDSYQLLSPKQWIYLANTGDVEGVYENIINKKPLKEEAVTLVAPEVEAKEDDDNLDPAIKSRFTTLDLTKDEEIKVDSEVLDENIDKMLEELEEHEDEVECQSCFELVAKESCTKNENGHYICEKCSHPKEKLEEEWDFVESLTESQAQEISKMYKSLSKDFGIDFEDLVWGETGFMMTKYPEGFPDFDGDVVYSEKYWEELVDFAASKGIDISDEGVLHSSSYYYDESMDLKESSSQKISRDYEDLSYFFGIDLWELVWGKQGFMKTMYPEGFSDFKGDVIYSEKYWKELVAFAETKGIDLNDGDEEHGSVMDWLFAECDQDRPDDNLEEETHAQFAKPEGNRVQAYNNALKYAKQYNKEFIYGYTNHTGKFFALDQPIKVTGTARDAEKEFRNKYKNCGVVYMVYPNKTFIKEEAELEN